VPRVLFVHHRPQASGAARSLALLIGALSDDWEAHVIVPDGPAAALFERSGATVYRGPVPAFTHTWDVQYHGLRWLVALREALWIPGHIRQLRRILRELQPDLVHVNDVVMLVSGAVAARAGYPVVWHLRSSLPHGGRDRRSRWICRILDRYSRTAIAIDQDVAATYDLRTGTDIVTNPVSASDGPKADLEVPGDAVTVGFLGYLRHQKGWPEFLEALRLLKDRGAAVHGVVVGGAVRPAAAFRGLRGRLLERIGVINEEKRFAESLHLLGLEDQMTWLPFTDNIETVLRALDIVVFPNQGAGLGRPVLEAAAFGKVAVVSGSAGGGGVLVQGETGILLSSGDPVTLADALGELAFDREQRLSLGRAAAAYAKRWVPEAAARKVEGIYTRVAPDTVCR
jgi:glycosyltransferase involved in cell wall biosynthesis